MIKIVALLLLTGSVYAGVPLECGRYTMVGQFNCETSLCSLKIFPESRSEIIISLDPLEKDSVKRMTGRNIRAKVTIYKSDSFQVKGHILPEMAMEYPSELGPKAIKLNQKEKCDP